MDSRAERRMVLPNACWSRLLSTMCLRGLVAGDGQPERAARRQSSNLRCVRSLDTGARGFIELKDWGANDAATSRVVKQLTAAYMRKHMGFPSQTSSPDKVEKFAALSKAKEVTSLPQAIALARHFSFKKGVNLSNDGTSPMMAVFKFMDTDGSGVLDRCAVHTDWQAAPSATGPRELHVCGQRAGARAGRVP